MLDAVNPVVITAGAIGDTLLALPALRALRKLFPQKLTVVCPPGFQKTFFSEFSSNFSCLPEMYMGRESWEINYEKISQTGQHYDLLIWLNLWHCRDPKSLHEAFQPDHSLAYYPGFTTKIAVDFQGHVADQLFALPQYLAPALRLQDFGYAPVFAASSEQHARQLRGLAKPGRKVLLVHADTKPEKMWPTRRFIQVLDLFLDRHPDYEVFVVGREDLGLNTGRYGSRVSLFYDLALSTSLALIGYADLFLGIDSCMLHAADLYDVPGVGLFGPTSPADWGFRFNNHHQHIYAPGDMRQIEVALVLEALESLVPASVLV